MKKKTVSRLSAMFMAGAMMVTMFGMSVCAAGVVTEENGITSVPVGKTVTTDGNTYAPNTSFEFEVATGSAGTYDNQVVTAGVANGLKPGSAAVSSPSAANLSSEYIIAGGALTVDATVFTAPGVYHYVVSEKNGGYEGIAYDSSSFDVYLYVYNGADGSFYVGNVVSVKGTEKADLSFVNNYGSGENDSTHDVKVVKSVQGNQGDKNKAFDFDVTVNGDVGELYKVVIKENASANEVVTSIANGTKAVYSIKDGGSIQIYGLSAKDEYTINEHDYSGEGYTTQNQNNSGSVEKDGTVITVTNTKEVATPTGIIASYAPYILMVVVAGAAVVFFLRRRNRAEF